MPKRKVDELSFAVRSCVVCDESRTEDNGKFLLIGVYSGDIVIREFPARMSLTAYLELELPSGEHQADMRFKVNGKTQSGMDGSLESLSEERVGFATARLPLVIEEPGYLEFEIQFDGSDWLTATRKRIITVSSIRASSAAAEGSLVPTGD